MSTLLDLLALGLAQLIVVVCVVVVPTLGFATVVWLLWRLVDWFGDRVRGTLK